MMNGVQLVERVDRGSIKNIERDGSAYHRKTKNHEWLHLVPVYRRPMTYHGIETLDEHVVGRCHVAKTCVSLWSMLGFTTE